MKFCNLVVSIAIGTIASLLIPGNSNGDVGGITFASAADPVARQLKPASKSSKASKSAKSSKSSKKGKKDKKSEEIVFPPICTGEDVIVADEPFSLPDSVLRGAYRITNPFETDLEVADTSALLPSVAAVGGLDVEFRFRAFCPLPSDDIYDYFAAVTDGGFAELTPGGPRGICRVLRVPKSVSAEPYTWTEYQNVGVDSVEPAIVEQDDGQILLKFSLCPDAPFEDVIVEATKV